MAILYTDDFNRADTAGGLGSNWRDSNGGKPKLWQIQSSTCQFNAIDGSIRPNNWKLVTAFLADQFSEVTYTGIFGGSFEATLGFCDTLGAFQKLGVTVRSQDANIPGDSGYFVVVNVRTKLWSCGLYFPNGVGDYAVSALGGSGTLASVSGGDVFRLTAVGNTVTAYQNGVIFASFVAVGGSILPTGMPGVTFGGGTDGHNDFQCPNSFARVDNWRGGTWPEEVPPPPPPIPPTPSSGSALIPGTYGSTTCGGLREKLALRLEDSAFTFWTNLELCLYINEALRTFGLLSAFWRERGTFVTTPGSVFYDLPTQLPSLLGYTVTDRDLIQIIQYHLLENASSQSAWTGTDMFTMADVAQAIERRRDQFLSDTGVVLTRQVIDVISPPSGRAALADNIIDIRRAAWLGASPEAYFSQLWREDEFVLTAAGAGWSASAGTPSAYSVLAPPPLRVQLAPPPLASGQLDLVTVTAGSALDPSTAPSILGIPDDTAWIIKWGALADLLGRDGQARDPIRAKFCEDRYQQGIQLVRMLPVVVHAELQGLASIPGTLASHDAADPNWQNVPGAPEELMIAGANLVAISKVPDAVYSVTLDVVRQAPICVCSTGAGFLQIGREQLDAILDYAEHLALFKVGGAEWDATQRQAQNFLLQAITYNQRLSAAARYVIKPKESSQAEKYRRPRRVEANGLGTLPSGGS